MFGRLIVTPVVTVKNCAVEGAVSELLKIAENPRIARWVQFPRSVFLFLIEPDHPQSGAAYILDRKNGTWYLVDFQDGNFGGYSLNELELLLVDCRFLTSGTTWSACVWLELGAGMREIPRSNGLRWRLRE